MKKKEKKKKKIKIITKKVQIIISPSLHKSHSNFNLLVKLIYNQFVFTIPTRNYNS